MSKKLKKVKKKPKSLRQIRKEKRRKKYFALFAFIFIIFSIVVVAWYLTSRPAPKGTLVIYVVDEHTNNPIGGATISISGPYAATEQSNEQGVYRFESIPVGTYTVTVTKEGYHVHPETATVEAGKTTDHTVRLHTYH